MGFFNKIIGKKEEQPIPQPPEQPKDQTEAMNQQISQQSREVDVDHNDMLMNLRDTPNTPDDNMGSIPFPDAQPGGGQPIEDQFAHHLNNVASTPEQPQAPAPQPAMDSVSMQANMQSEMEAHMNSNMNQGMNPGNMPRPELASAGPDSEALIKPTGQMPEMPNFADMGGTINLPVHDDKDSLMNSVPGGNDLMSSSMDLSSQMEMQPPPTVPDMGGLDENFKVAPKNEGALTQHSIESDIDHQDVGIRQPMLDAAEPAVPVQQPDMTSPVNIQREHIHSMEEGVVSPQNTLTPEQAQAMIDPAPGVTAQETQKSVQEIEAEYNKQRISQNAPEIPTINQMSNQLNSIPNPSGFGKSIVSELNKGNEIFLSVKDLKEVFRIVDGVNNDIRTTQGIMLRVKDVNKDIDVLYDGWRLQLGEIQKELMDFDRILFSR